MSLHSRPTRSHNSPSDARPFRRADALRAGLSIRDITGPRYQRVFHGIYLPTGVPLNHQTLARAALLTATDAGYASHHTAARFWGGITPADSRTHISVPDTESRSERRGIAAHVAVPSADVRTQHGVRVSSPTQCFCELAAVGVSLVDLVVLGDSLMKAGAVSITSLIEAADRWGSRGAQLASRAARLVREGVDSAMESRLRMLIVLAGLPEPTVNMILRHDTGEWRMRFDLCYPELKLLIEYDGGHHVTDSRQRARDLERREELEQVGWRFIVVQKEHIYSRPARVLERIRQARLDRGADSTTCRVRPTWRKYFA